ncbi:hypothetical protein GH714_001231 [Hevea brasiliensis]|uniref:Transmembrane 9 superfamily member n=1 Tax=Hevea brasiliensis TaxID=3981 RepID=A0A6A6LSX1_HEVBR|nr:hypothetical protein GH714_001231 [Hevea brasiliensis]
MRMELFCQVACRVTLDAESAGSFKEKIDDQYRVNMILDNLPVAVLSQSQLYEHGFPVGFKSREDKYFINNHLSFKVKYHVDPVTDSARIVGFEVNPISINHEYKNWDENNTRLTTCNSQIQDNAVTEQIAIGEEIVFTYDVSFEASNLFLRPRPFSLCIILFLLHMLPTVQRNQMGFALGHVPSYERQSDSLVLHY